MVLHIVIICTNKYYKLGIRLASNISKYYKGNTEIVVNLFTHKNPLSEINNIKCNYYPTIHPNWQNGTNSKFISLLTVMDTNNLSSNDYIFFMDADTNIINDFDETLFIGDLVGLEHFNNVMPTKVYDRNVYSKAFIPYTIKKDETYYWGSLFGGSIESVKSMCTTIILWQQYDKLILNYEPIWNDESYINKYFYIFPPSKTILFKDFPFVHTEKADIGDRRSFQDEDIKEVCNFPIIHRNINY